MSEPDAFSAMTVSSARADRGPERRPAAAKEQSREETDSRHPRIDQKDLPDAFQPVNRQIAQTDALQRRESRRKRRIGHMRRRKSVHGARREQKHPRTKDERKSERIDLPRRHHVVESRTHPCRQRRTEHQRQPHPDGIAHERRKRAPHQHAVEAPESLLAVLGRKAEQIPRHRGDGHAQQGAPAHKSLSLGIGAPENADHKQKSRPRAVLKHHLPGTAQQNFDKIERASAGPSGSSDRICHTYNYLTVNKVSIATGTLRAAACP